MRSMPITSPVERISGPSSESTSGKRSNGRTASFTLTCSGRRPPPSASMPSARSSASVGPSMVRAATLASGDARRLGDERDRPARPRVRLDDEDLPLLHGVLDVERPEDSERGGDAARVVLDEGHGRVVERRRRDHAGRVAGVHAGLLDVLHDRPDQHLAGDVADGVDVDLDRVLEEPVDEHRAHRPPAGPRAPSDSRRRPDRESSSS